MLVVFDFQIVHVRVVADDHAGEIDVAGEQGLDRAFKIQPAEAGHQEDLVLEAGHGIVDLMEDVGLVHSWRRVPERKIEEFGGWWDGALPEATGDVIFGFSDSRVGEHALGFGKLDQFSQVEEGGPVGNAGCLLHVVGDDDEGVVVFQAPDEFLDLGGGDGIERAARLVHQDNERFHRDGTGDAKALLLASGEAKRGFLEAVLHLVPEGGRLEAFLDGLGDDGVVALAAHAQAEGDVFENAGREGIGFLEDHAHIAAEFHDIDGGIMDVDAFDEDFALGDAGADDFVVHAVDAAQQGGFAATGGADEGGDLVLFQCEGDVLQRLGGTITERYVVDLHGSGGGRGDGRFFQKIGHGCGGWISRKRR